MHKLRSIWKKIKVEINEFKNWITRKWNKLVSWLFNDWS
tara:strand:- start:449 stop:565 length:117 start_codon:yes stop_codon:yes gene_type:complete